MLHARLGDPQALKACIAAALAGVQLEVKEAGAACLGGALGASELALVLPGQDVLTDGNAIASYLGAASQLVAVQGCRPVGMPTCFNLRSRRE